MRELKNAELVEALASAGRVGSDLTGGCLGWRDPVGTGGSYAARRVSAAALAGWVALFRAAGMRRDLPAVGEWIVLWYGAPGVGPVATVLSPAEGAVLAIWEGSLRPEGFARVLRDPMRYLGMGASPTELRVIVAALAAELTAASVPSVPIAGARRANGAAPAPVKIEAPAASDRGRGGNGKPGARGVTEGPPSPVRSRSRRTARRRTVKAVERGRRLERERIVAALTGPGPGRRARYVRGGRAVR